MFLTRTIPRFPVGQWYVEKVVSAGINVKSRSGSSYAVSLVILERDSTARTVTTTVKSRSGSSYVV